MLSRLITHWSWPFVVSLMINIVILFVFTRLTIIEAAPAERRVLLEFLPDIIQPLPASPDRLEKISKKIVTPKVVKIPVQEKLAFDLLKVKPDDLLPPQPEKTKTEPPKIDITKKSDEHIEENGMMKFPAIGSENPAKGGAQENSLIDPDINNDWNTPLPSGSPRVAMKLQVEAGNLRDGGGSPLIVAGGSPQSRNDNGGGQSSIADLNLLRMITSPNGEEGVSFPGQPGVRGNGGGIPGINRLSPSEGGRSPGDSGNRPGNKGPGSDSPLQSSISGPGGSGVRPAVTGFGGDDNRTQYGVNGANGPYNFFGAGGLFRQIDPGARSDASLSSNAPNPGLPTLDRRHIEPPGGGGTDPKGIGIGSTGGKPKLFKWQGEYPSEAFMQNVQGDVDINVTFDEKGKVVAKSISITDWKDENGNVDSRVKKLLGKAVRDKVLTIVLSPDEIPYFDGEPMKRTIYYRFQFRIKW